MNRLLLVSVSALLIVAAGRCKDVSPRQKSPDVSAAALQPSGGEKNVDLFGDSLRLDTLFDLVRQREIAVAADPSNRRLHSQLLAAALDTAIGCFFIIGQGVTDTALPDDAKPRAQKIAAKFAAQQWAFYCKGWCSGGKIRYGGRISGQVLYAKSLRERVHGDTLFVLFMVPLGSVVLK